MYVYIFLNFVALGHHGTMSAKLVKGVFISIGNY